MASKKKWTEGHAALKNAVEKYGQTAVVSKCEMSRQTVWRYLQGQRTPEVPLAVKMRDHYGIPIEAWLEDVEYETDGV